jgi:hypothetical protein
MGLHCVGGTICTVFVTFSDVGRNFVAILKLSRNDARMDGPAEKRTTQGKWIERKSNTLAQRRTDFSEFLIVLNSKGLPYLLRFQSDKKVICNKWLFIHGCSFSHFQVITRPQAPPQQSFRLSSALYRRQ